MVDAEEDVVEDVQFEKKKKKLAKKGIILKTKEEKRVARRAREKARKNKKKSKKDDDFDDFRDSVEFGEVVHAPPALSFKNKKLEAGGLEDRRPGRGNLILKQRIDGAAVIKKPKAPKPSLARQAMMETERQRVVEAYRALKAERMAR